jgi:hypothetical protein
MWRRVVTDAWKDVVSLFSQISRKMEGVQSVETLGSIYRRTVRRITQESNLHVIAVLYFKSYCVHNVQLCFVAYLLPAATN